MYFNCSLENEKLIKLSVNSSRFFDPESREIFLLL
jgi:hypothetical protein